MAKPTRSSTGGLTVKVAKKKVEAKTEEKVEKIEAVAKRPLDSGEEKPKKKRKKQVEEEERKAARRKRIVEKLAARPVREKRDLVSDAPLNCQVWLYANPMDIALKTLRQYIPGISSIFWLKEGTGYASFDNDGACRNALRLGEVNADGSTTRISVYCKDGKEKVPAPAEEQKAVAEEGEEEGEVLSNKAKKILMGMHLGRVAKSDRDIFDARLKASVSNSQYSILIKKRQEHFDVIPRTSEEMGYEVKPKGHMPASGRDRHYGKPKALLSNKPTFIATAALKKRLPGLEVVQWVQAKKDKDFRASGFEGARVCFKTPEQAAEAIKIVRYNCHGSEVYVRGHPKKNDESMPAPVEGEGEVKPE